MTAQIPPPRNTAQTTPRAFPEDFPAPIQRSDPAQDPARDPGQLTASEIIELAWCDQTPFKAILAQTGLTEAQVIKLMRREMKPRSFRMWRERVAGR